jgi:hypothetical protein
MATKSRNMSGGHKDSLAYSIVLHQNWLLLLNSIFRSLDIYKNSISLKDTVAYVHDASFYHYIIFFILI